MCQGTDPGATARVLSKLILRLATFCCFRACQPSTIGSAKSNAATFLKLRNFFGLKTCDSGVQIYLYSNRRLEDIYLETRILQTDINIVMGELKWGVS